jgi:oxygen-independent coproporphyrinogen-3 oxidase
MNTRWVQAERSVPRYTSYPTAPHFSATIGPDQYESWLAKIAPGRALSLYIHVPFCTEICHYCGCHTKAARQRGPIEHYAECLAEEITLVAKITGLRKVTHLHWGGGTPSILGPENLHRLIDKIAANFNLSDLQEHAIELDPRHVAQPLVESLAAIKVNRASLGVQDFTPRVQKAIGRVQPFDIVARAVATIRAAGIERLNLDLMYGLPFQSCNDIKRNVELAASLTPQRFAIFGYAHVPWLKKNQRLIDQAALPGLSERIAQARIASQTMLSLGYQAVGLDHFAAPRDDIAIASRTGRLRRNFQGYTTDQADALIGLGASAIGKLPQGFVQNAADTGSYYRAIGAGTLATVKGIQLSEDDHLRGILIERLMCDLAVDLDRIAGRSDAVPADKFSSELLALQPFVADGLVKIDGRRVVITGAGRPFVRLVAAVFDAYLSNDRARHSIAV